MHNINNGNMFSAKVEIAMPNEAQAHLTAAMQSYL
jgi:hypothetical protein